MEESHPSRGAWIEMRDMRDDAYIGESHPSRGAWIEIPIAHIVSSISCTSHPSRGAWIEIYKTFLSPHKKSGRTPRGVRGLKWRLPSVHFAGSSVAPLAGCVD